MLDPGLSVVETGEQHAVLRLPWTDRLAREGGALSGQALMADTATVIAISSARGGHVPMATVQQSTSFQRALVDADVLIEARVTKLGRRMAFADITMTAEGASEPAARASTVHALLGPSWFGDLSEFGEFGGDARVIGLPGHLATWPSRYRVTFFTGWVTCFTGRSWLAPAM